MQVARGRVSLQERVRRRTRAGLVARRAERELFRRNFDTSPDDERHRFLFHVHGAAGVGKTRLVKEFEHLAREQGALTAYVDETSGSVPEVLEAVSRQFALQGHRLKDLERTLATHRERRHEAETAALAALDPAPDGAPSAGGMALARAGLAGLGLVPGVAPFTAVLDPEQLAHGADRLRTVLAARFRSHEDVRLVLDPASVLTPVLADELDAVAADVPWLVLLLDTYERTGPFLDAWLHDLLTTDRYGVLPDTVVVVTAGQHPADPARWGTFADFMTSLPLQPFTEAEARGLLAERGVTAEPVVAEALRLTGGLPVLLSTIAGTRPAGPEDVTDPSATAVERFLKWEQDPGRRSAALAGALPRLLDVDVFAVAADCDRDRAEELYAWVETLPFADRLGGRLRYHDIVRAPMLRLQRGRSPRSWTDGHRRLAYACRLWREQMEDGRDTGTLWLDETWCELRLGELYHRLCADEAAAVSDTLQDLVEACDQGEALAGRWIRVLEDAGRDATVPDAVAWGEQLAGALAAGGTEGVLDAVLTWTGAPPPQPGAAPPGSGPVWAQPGSGPVPADAVYQRGDTRPVPEPAGDTGYGAPPSQTQTWSRTWPAYGTIPDRITLPAPSSPASTATAPSPTPRGTTAWPPSPSWAAPSPSPPTTPAPSACAANSCAPSDSSRKPPPTWNAPPPWTPPTPTPGPPSAPPASPSATRRAPVPPSTGPSPSSPTTAGPWSAAPAWPGSWATRRAASPPWTVPSPPTPTPRGPTANAGTPSAPPTATGRPSTPTTAPSTSTPGTRRRTRAGASPTTASATSTRRSPTWTAPWS